MTHMLGLVLFLLFLQGSARRSIRVDESHRDAQQQNNVFTNGLVVSGDAREALIPGGFEMGVLRRAHSRFDPCRAKVALHAKPRRSVAPLRPAPRGAQDRNAHSSKATVLSRDTALSDGTANGSDTNTSSGAALGLASLAGSATAATVLSTAGGVCAGGGCVAAGGAVAGAAAGTAGAAAGSGAAAAGAAAGAGGLQSLLAGAAVTAATIGSFVFGGMSQDLNAMVAASTPLQEAIRNGNPTVLEFYRPLCRYCNLAASGGLQEVEAAARAQGINWVMLSTDDSANRKLVDNYGVYELPHFEFLTPQGDVLSRSIHEEGGPVDVERIAARMALLKDGGGGVFP